jgi:hypothetical protein
VVRARSAAGVAVRWNSWKAGHRVDIHIQSECTSLCWCFHKSLERSGDLHQRVGLLCIEVEEAHQSTRRTTQVLL